MSEPRDVLIALTAWDAEHWRARFQKLVPDRKVFIDPETADPARIGYIATWKHKPGSLARFTNLKAIFSLGAGVDHMFLDPDLPDVPMARIVDPDLTERMGEWVALHVLRHHRQHDRYATQQKAKDWNDDRDQPAAAEIRVGIMGLGVLGQHAAKVLKVIGFDVAGWSRSRREVPGLKSYAGAEELPAFLARTDILVALLPLTDDTRGIFNLNLFKGLAQDGKLGGPFFLNAGRGGLQVEGDILTALDAGILQAVTLDVFETEPLPKDSSLWTHRQVNVTPHNAAMSAPDAISKQIVQQIERLERGEPLENVVDRKAGY